MDLYFYSYRWRHLWRNYYRENKVLCDFNISKLLENLDAESIIHAKNLLKYNLETSHFGLIKSMLVSYFKSKTSSLKMIKSKYKLGNNSSPDEYLQTYKNGFYYVEQSFSEYVLGKDFIDGGAYVGDSAVVLNELNPKAIHSFEPNLKNFQMLSKTIEINNLENKIFANKMGLDSESKTIFFKGSSVRHRVSDVETKNQIEVVSIDEYVEQNNLNVGLIKLDVESLEYNVILGAKETIQKYKPVLLISVYHTLKDFLEIKPLIESYGVEYDFMIRPTHNYSLNLEFMLIATPKN